MEDIHQAMSHHFISVVLGNSWEYAFGLVTCPEITGVGL